MTRTLTCIICPRGCALTATVDAEKVIVAGNACPKGAQYAVDECIHPLRMVTSVVRVSNRTDRMVSVKTVAPVPKEHIFDVMGRIRAAQVEAPVAIGDVVLADVYGTAVIATKAVD